MAVTTATFAKTVGNTEFEKPMRIKADKEIWPYKKIFSTGTTKRAETKFYSHTGFGAAQPVGELEPLYFEDPLEGPERTLSVKKISIGTSLSEEMEDDNLHLPGLLNTWSDAMGDSHSYVKSYDHAKRFNRAFATTYSDYTHVNYADTAEAIFADTHTCANGDTYDNLFPAASFDYATAQDMERYFLTGMVDEQGLPITDELKCILFASDLIDVISNVYKTRKGEPGTADWSTNTLSNPDLVPCRLLSPTTMYVMIGKKAGKYLLSRQRKAMQVKWWDDNERNGRKVNCWQRYGEKILDPRFMVASLGA